MSGPDRFHVGVGAHLNPAASMTAPGEPPKAKNGSSGGFLAFWTTLPGILTGVAALITAIVGLATLVHSWTGTSQNAAPLQTSATATNSASATSESTSSGQQATGTVENGRLALRRGDAADLEHGQVGFSATEDIMFGPETTPSLHAAGTAFLAPIQTMPSKPTCRRALSGQRDTAEAIPDLSAPWICVSTTEGHVASVEILQAPGVGSADLELKYSVWY
jgi:hypothetical protein